MAVQKSKVTRSRRGQRRSHDALANPTLSVEPTSGETHRRQEFVELDSSLRSEFFRFAQGESHCDTHPKVLRCLDTTSINVEKITIVNRLQAEVTKALVSAGFKSRRNFDEIETSQVFGQTSRPHAFDNVVFETTSINLLKLTSELALSDGLAIDDAGL